MYNIELNSFIDRIIQTFYRFGLWDSKNGTSFFDFVQKLLNCSLMFASFASLVSGAYSSNDQNECIFASATAIASFVITFRVFKLIFEKKSIIDFLQEFSYHSTCDSEEFVLINKKLKTFVKFSLCFLFLCAGCLIINLCVPFVLKEKAFIVNIGFPLDYKNNSFSFCLAYAFVAVGCSYAFFSMLLSIIIWYLMLNCVIKYEVLGNQLRKLGAEEVSESSEESRIVASTKEKQELYLQDLIKAIESNLNINRMLDEFSKCFEDVFFIQIATSRISICGSIYSLIFTSNDSVIYYTIYCIFIIYNLFDIFIVMFLGNKIKESSDKLSYCLFESDWIDQTQDCKKSVLILGELLKRPREIVICKLYPLNLQSFTMILNGAYSMFNILQNLK